jgi:general L-amino acid transport system ATP-binding protein
MTTENNPRIYADATRAKGKPIIEVAGVDKFFGDFQALKAIDINIGLQEVVVVIGPSGSGKSTLIRCINRLEKHDRGRIVVDGIELSDDARSIQEVRREPGMVFQQLNLFPHLSVMDNITLAPRYVRHESKADADANAMKLLERVGIPEQAAKYPGQLSGGQQQRVAIARAILASPQILILDEATSNLDTESEQLIQESMAALLAARTTFVIAHRLSTIRRADLILLMDEGRIIERGTHEQLMRAGGTYYTMALRQMESPEHTVEQTADDY